MPNHKIEPGTEQEIETLSDRLFEFNMQIVPGFTGRKGPIDIVRYVIKNEGKAVAGLLGKLVINNVLCIDDLFVEEAFRNQGYASSLLEHIESEAKSRGCYLAYLDTINTDALTFYTKRGYQVFAELNDVPCRGVTDFYLKKHL